jgi:hypothetical protein
MTRLLADGAVGRFCRDSSANRASAPICDAVVLGSSPFCGGQVCAPTRSRTSAPRSAPSRMIVECESRPRPRHRDPGPIGGKRMGPGFAHGQGRVVERIVETTKKTTRSRPPANSVNRALRAKRTMVVWHPRLAVKKQMALATSTRAKWVGVTNVDRGAENTGLTGSSVRCAAVGPRIRSADRSSRHSEPPAASNQAQPRS